MVNNLDRKKILIANRGEIALRAINAARSLNFSTVSVYSTADKLSSHVMAADENICIGPPAAKDSYLSGKALIHIAKKTKCDAIYPGYGFLSENASFASNCNEAGLKFIGPSGQIIQDMGQKDRAREIVSNFGVPVVPGSNKAFYNCDEALQESDRIGYPLLLKARSGGGGKGMRIVSSKAEFTAAFAHAFREAESAFSDGALYIERFFPKVRHIEIQILGDGRGGALAFDERDCSIQRRHQKLIEESPSPVIDKITREKLKSMASKIVQGMEYEGAGTIEFIFDVETKEFFFIEMNTRIQVEHPITEVRNNIDLVETQIKIALCGEFPDSEDIQGSLGHAIEFRINAEDSENNFMPSPGVLQTWDLPYGEGIRVDTAEYAGSNISPYYDSMIGKLIIHDNSREKAVIKAQASLDRFHLRGIKTTIPFHKSIIKHQAFLNNDIHTRWVESEFINSKREIN